MDRTPSCDCWYRQLLELLFFLLAAPSARKTRSYVPGCRKQLRGPFPPRSRSTVLQMARFSELQLDIYDIWVWVCVGHGSPSNPGGISRRAGISLDPRLIRGRVGLRTATPGCVFWETPDAGSFLSWSERSERHAWEVSLSHSHGPCLACLFRGGFYLFKSLHLLNPTRDAWS